MKKLITVLLVASTTLTAVPATAKTLKFTEGKLAGHELIYKTWSQAKCDTYPEVTKAQNRRMVQNCIGKMSKKKYEKKYYQFLTDYRNATDQRVQDISVLGFKALAHPDIRWKSDGYQRDMDNGKIAASVIGTFVASLPAIHLAFAGGLFNLLMVGASLTG